MLLETKNIGLVLFSISDICFGTYTNGLGHFESSSQHWLPLLPFKFSRVSKETLITC